MAPGYRRREGRGPRAPAAHRGAGPWPAADGRRGPVLHRRPGAGLGGDPGAAGGGPGAPRRPSGPLRGRRRTRGRGAARPSSTRRRRPWPGWCGHEHGSGSRGGGGGPGGGGRRVTPVVPTVAVAGPGSSTPSVGACREGLAMFWSTLWPLVLGFSLSGAVRRSSTVTPSCGAWGTTGLARWCGPRGTGWCRRRAPTPPPAMAKSLVVRGVDFVAACVFMFASTNRWSSSDSCCSCCLAGSSWPASSWGAPS